MGDKSKPTLIQHVRVSKGEVVELQVCSTAIFYFNVPNPATVQGALSAVYVIRACFLPAA